MTSWTQGTPGDVTAAIITLQRRFPASSVWFGTHTFRWWAMMPCTGRWVLLEAATPMELARRMSETRGSALLGSGSRDSRDRWGAH